MNVLRPRHVQGITMQFKDIFTLVTSKYVVILETDAREKERLTSRNTLESPREMDRR